MTVALQLTKCNSNRPITVSQQSGARGYAGLDEDVTVGTVLDQATGNKGRMVTHPGIVLSVLDPSPCIVLGHGRRVLTKQASAVQAQRRRSALRPHAARSGLRMARFWERRHR